MPAVGMGIELGEVFVEGGRADGEHEGLVAVVAGPPVAAAEGAGHGQLRHLLAVAEDAELGLAGQHFLAADEAHLPAAEGNPVVLENALTRELRANLLRLLWCGHVRLRRNGWSRAGSRRRRARSPLQPES